MSTAGRRARYGASHAAVDPAPRWIARRTRGRRPPGRAAVLAEDRRASAPSTSSRCSARRSSFPLIMGLDPNLAIMMSGVCTILFLLVIAGRMP